MGNRTYYIKRNGVIRDGEQVEDLLNKIEDLEDATEHKSGTMSKYDKKKLDQDVPDRELSVYEIDEIISRLD